MIPLLQLKNIRKSFPGVKALDGVDLTLQSGEIHALLGENGAGKSTLMKILSGIYQPDEGEIILNGDTQKFKNYRNAISAGIGIIFQEFSLIPYLNATENIFLNREIKNKFGFLDKAAMTYQAKKLFKGLEIDINLSVPISQLSVAQQQFVEIAKALSLNAKVLILDEPTATLTPAEAEHLFQIMNDLKLQGVGMIFISHHLDEIFEVCDKITVLRDGQYISTTNVKDTNVDELVALMVGRKLEQAFPEKLTVPHDAPTLIEASIQHKKDDPIDTFSVKQGEILGFAGLVGSGRTELALALIGASKCHTKSVKLQHKNIKIKNPSDALNHGIGLLPESRKTQGLVLPFSIERNITLNKNEKKLGLLINHKNDLKIVLEQIKSVGVKTPSHETAVNTLSGGNQQKVVIARWLHNPCKILIFDEPTRGIDVGAKAEIYEIMQQLVIKGVSVIIISSELPEILGLCNRVLVFRSGHIVAELAGENINSQNIMLEATGN
ncbi:sugar ABC transporter ATP-binding protein [Thorsellia anophelis]|uniref:Monosaccharide ABC transporter ATP-binding protein, CUT2 family n=1 Tax=Thorsellia anophelis DSM 18579 TaxID=1123402 RepID=A0A1I0B8K8_9GAMM|nr:sugar ABC transporter ATP-binding protein [Thorsellia anophelis]SET03206.1 monosaccharide ABC transporter ATP-binding protein, CUT2 family [Thorsellia anophelis DSM 18579]